MIPGPVFSFMSFYISAIEYKVSVKTVLAVLRHTQSIIFISLAVGSYLIHLQLVSLLLFVVLCPYAHAFCMV